MTTASKTGNEYDNGRIGSELFQPFTSYRKQVFLDRLYLFYQQPNGLHIYIPRGQNTGICFQTQSCPVN